MLLALVFLCCLPNSIIGKINEECIPDIHLEHIGDVYTWNDPRNTSSICTFKASFPDNAFLLVDFTKADGQLLVTDSRNISLIYGFLDEPRRLYMPAWEATFLFQRSSFWYEDHGHSAYFEVVRNDAFKKWHKFSPITEPRFYFLPDSMVPGETYLFQSSEPFKVYYRNSHYSLYEPSYLVFNGTDSNASYVASLDQWSMSSDIFDNTDKTMQLDGSRYTDLAIYVDTRKSRIDSYDSMLFMVPEDYWLPYRDTNVYFVGMKEQYNILKARDGKKAFVSFVNNEYSMISDRPYYLYRFEFSKDVRFWLVDGLPQRSIWNNTVIRKFNASNMTPDINFCLNGTRSIIVLRGTLKFWYNLTLPLVEANLFSENEQKGTVWIEQSGQTASWNYRRDNLWTYYSNYYWWMRHEFVWREDADPNVYVEISEEHVYDFDYDSLKSWIFVPSNLSAIITEKNLKWKLFGKGTFDYSRTNIPAPSTTTTEGPSFFEQLFG